MPDQAQTLKNEAYSPRALGTNSPSPTLPKGGGAIGGFGEKFAANPVTGNGSVTVPIATSPGRSGFGLQLPLAYDPGAGNGSLGFWWSLSLPPITRKTDKVLPTYDADESGVLILWCAKDLVPVLVQIDGAVAARTGMQRLRCKASRRTFTSATLTPPARVRRPEKFQQVLDGMLVAPRAPCRELAARLGVNRMTVWAGGCASSARGRG